MPPKPKVFVTRRLPDAGLKLIHEACRAEVWPDQLPPPAAVLRQKVADCDGLVSLLTDTVDAAFLDKAPRLKVVSNFAVGFNNIDVKACTERGVSVGNTPGVLPTQMPRSVHAFTSMLLNPTAKLLTTLSRGALSRNAASMTSVSSATRPSQAATFWRKTAAGGGS